MDTTHHRGSRPRLKLDFNTEMAILERYAKTSDSIKHIAQAFGVTSTYPYRVLDKYAIVWRRGSPEEFDFDQWRAMQSPPAKQTPLPEIPAPAALKTFEVEAAQRWVIEITESFEVESWDIDEALAQAHQLRPGARVTSVRTRP